MKRIIALLLSVMMVMTSSLAFAEIPYIPSMTITNAVTFNRDAINQLMNSWGMKPEDIENIESKMTAVETSSQKLIIVKDGFEYSLILNGNNVCTIDGDFTPEGVTIGSNLFPRYALSMSSETFTELVSRFVSESLVEERKENSGLMAAVLAVIESQTGSLFKTLMSTVTVGNPETGTFTVDGETYNTMNPITINVRNALDGVLVWMDGILHSKPVLTLQSVLKRLDIDLPLEVPAITGLPIINISCYSSLDQAGKSYGPEYTIVEIAGDDGKVSLITAHVRTEGDNIRVKLDIPGANTVLQVERYQSYEHNFARLDASFGGVYYGLSLDESFGDEIHYSFNVFYLDDKFPLVSDDITVVSGGKRLYNAAGSDKKVLSLEGLLSGDENASLLNMLSNIVFYTAIEAISSKY